jgi:hypothetical protein
MWTKRTFLTALGSLPFLSSLKPAAADTIIRKTYRGINYTYTPEFAKDLKAVYGLYVDNEAANVINTCLDLPCAGYDTIYFDGRAKSYRRIANIEDRELKLEYKNLKKPPEIA